MNYDPAREEDIAIVSRTTRARALKREADRLRDWAFQQHIILIYDPTCGEAPEAYDQGVAILQALDRYGKGDRSPSTMRWVYPLIDAYNRDKSAGEQLGA